MYKLQFYVFLQYIMSCAVLPARC